MKQNSVKYTVLTIMKLMAIPIEKSLLCPFKAKVKSVRYCYGYEESPTINDPVMRARLNSPFNTIIDCSDCKNYDAVENVCRLFRASAVPEKIQQHAGDARQNWIEAKCL